jgi:MFS family permease
LGNPAIMMSRNSTTEGGKILTAHDDLAPSVEVATKKQSLSDIFTIVRLPVSHLYPSNKSQIASGVALISDGYFNNTMTMVNVLLTKEYPKQYTAAVKTRVSNALLVGEIFGQLTIGLTCDYLGRKFAIILTTLMIVFGGILATASNGFTISGMFWMMTIARGIIGFGVGGKRLEFDLTYHI